VLLVAVGSYAKRHGGEFLFFMPSVRAAENLPTNNWRLPGYSWLLDEPRVIASAIVVGVAALLFWPHRRRWRDDAAVRFAGGVAAASALTVAGLALWEFALGGIAVFDIPYYFSVFTPLLVLSVGSAFGLAVSGSAERTATRWTAAAIVLAAAPVSLLYGVSFTALEGRTGFWIVVAVGGAVIAIAASARFVPQWLGCGVAVSVIAVGVLEFSAAASLSSTRFGMPSAGVGSFSGRVATASLADQLIAFMRRERLQSLAPNEPPTNFWINQRDSAVDSIQSSYLFGITAAGLELPRLDITTKQLLASRRPSTLVLLCRTSEVCLRGRDALRHGGYAPHLRAADTLVAGDQMLLVRAYTLPGFALGAPEDRFYGPSQSELVPPPSVRPEQSWRLDDGLPAGWSGSDLQKGGVLVTAARQSWWELVSPKLDLAPGRYELSVAGRVLRGGLQLGINDVDRQEWIAQRGYWHKQRFAAGRRMAARFAVAKKTTVTIILQTWVPSDVSSRWLIRQIDLIRLGP
jgi:hypothetical protein